MLKALILLSARPTPFPFVQFDEFPFQNWEGKFFCTFYLLTKFWPGAGDCRARFFCQYPISTNFSPIICAIFQLDFFPNWRYTILKDKERK